MRKTFYALGVCLLALLVGCTAESPQKLIINTVTAPANRSAAVAGTNSSLYEVAELPAAPLTLKHAIELALQRNPGLKAQAAAVERASAQLSLSYARVYPQLVGEAGYMRGDDSMHALMKKVAARTFQPAEDFNNPGVFDNFEAGLGLRWNVWSGGRDLLGIDVARNGVSAAEAYYRATEQRLVASVIGAFLNHQTARELLKSDEASIRSVAAQVREAQAKVDAGTVVRSDLLSLKVRLAEAKERKIRTENGAGLAIAALRQLLSLTPDTKLILEYSKPILPVLAEELTGAVNIAQRERAELLAAQRRVDASKLELTRSRRAYLPTLDFESRLYGGSVPAAWDLGRDNWYINLGLTQSLFDGGQRSAEVDRAQAVLEQSVSELEQVRSLVTAEVETALLALNEAKERLKVTEQAVRAAVEGLELVEKQYAGGTVVVTRFLEAEAAKSRAEGARIMAGLEMEQTQVELARVLGLLGSEGSGRPE